MVVSMWMCFTKFIQCKKNSYWTALCIPLVTAKPELLQSNMANHNRHAGVWEQVCQSLVPDALETKCALHCPPNQGESKDCHMHLSRQHGSAKITRWWAGGERHTYQTLAGRPIARVSKRVQWAQEQGVASYLPHPFLLKYLTMQWAERKAAAER